MTATPLAIPRQILGPAAPAGRPAPTVWGLDPVQLHSRFWASRGIQVVRPGERSEIVEHAELFLLTDPATLAIFRLTAIIEQISWLGCDLMFVRLSDNRDRGYRERVVTGADGSFRRFEREYGASDPRRARVALTTDQEFARVWQSAPDPTAGWKRLRRVVRRQDRWTMSVKGRVYDRQSEAEVAAFVRDLVETWKRPDSTIQSIRPVSDQAWAPENTRIDGAVRFIGPVWIGAGRQFPPGKAVVGPAVVWDAPDAAPKPEDISWLDLEPSAPPTFPVPRKKARGARVAKRLFDIAFASAAVAATLPLYPVIAAAIWIEDPGPVFFVHTRETMGGRVFGCIKFRSMRRDAENIKRQIQAQNKADGPQFYIPNDPRLTRVGAFLRKYQLDEFPQFLNVLMGHMSIVGPRPSPFEENQYCPPWREARLSVRPGITGLWQIKRTRRAGSDFQEWIKYDIEYVERGTFRTDLYIIWKTVTQLVRGVTRS
jgi:lipopolysaccharide/colanic/teichoic acid biosynthesis glycosyltransferase